VRRRRRTTGSSTRICPEQVSTADQERGRRTVSDDPFVVHVARLRRVAGARWHEVRRGLVDPDHLLVPIRGADSTPGLAGADSTPGLAGADSTPGLAGADSTVPEGAEAICDVILQSFDGGVMVTGTVQAPWQGVCRRCTVPVGGDLRIAVREPFADIAGRHPGGAGLQPGDDEVYPIVNDELDLGPMVRDAVVLELPLAPLCREDCRGLCVHCGADRNTEKCGCVAPKDPRWASLDLLRSAR